MKVIKFGVVLLLLSSLALPLRAHPQVVTGAIKSLPSIGLRMRVFANMLARPMKMPEQYGAGDDKIVRALEWWRFNQTVCSWWSDACGIQIAEVKYPPLTEDSQIQLSQLNRVLAPAGRPLTTEELRSWVELYTRCRVERVPEAVVTPQRRTQEFILAPRSGDVVDLIYVVSPVKNPERQILIRYLIGAGVYDEQTRRLIRQTLSSIQFSAPQQDSGPRRVGVPGKKPGDVTPEYAASRKRALDSIRGFRDWWYMESPNYILISNSANQRQVSQFRGQLERSRRAFERIFPAGGDSQVGVVRIYNTRDEYLSAVEPELSWSAGYFSPSRGELVISPLDPRIPESQRITFTRQTVMHEGFHQYMHGALRGCVAGMWFHEGFAQFFEGLNFRGDSAAIALPPEDERKLKAFFAGNRVYALEPLLKMDSAAFQSGDIMANYNLSHALAYYLLKGSCAPEISCAPLRYYDTLKRTGDIEEANRAAWGDIDLEALSRQLSAFWQNDQRIRDSLRVDPFE